jgi:hypothetical protein
LLKRKIEVTAYLQLKKLGQGSLGYIGMDNPIPKKTSYLVPSLTLVEEEQDDDVKTSTESISYILKQKAGATGSTASTYKIYVKILFSHG